ncbi:hypothetical protein TWF718_003446 [Orbilia javanica]|uniref:Uncharacterized protein n=1 Tax=Orbilia javanica TaxID=47235 RepID=A0AAN8MM02_9PEZI
MYLRILLGLYLPLLASAIPVNLPFLRFDSFTNFLDDLYVLRTDIQTQNIRSDLTDSYIQGLINQAREFEAASPEDVDGVPPSGLVAKAVKYFDFVRNLTGDFPPDASAALKLIEEDGVYGLVNTKDILEAAAEEEKQAEAITQEIENDINLYNAENEANLFATPLENGEILREDDYDDFYTAIADPPLDLPARYIDRVAGGGVQGVGARVWENEGRRARDLESYEEEKARDPGFGRVVRNLYEEFKEEEMNQDSDDSDEEGLLWYENFLGPDDGFFDDPDAPAGV